jgi:hypothetical protein
MCVSRASKGDLKNANHFLGTFCEVEDVRLKVKWDYCCAHKKISGLNLTNLNETLLGLLCEWNLYVFELGDFSFKFLICHKLNRCIF